jgi:hypothetical protein
MTDSGAPPVRFACDSPREALFARIQTEIASTPASAIGTRTRVLIALAVASVLSAAAVLIASRTVYHRYAPGLGVQAASAPHTIAVLLLLVALTVVATIVATWRGRAGFGSGAKSLCMTSVLVAPMYAVLVAVTPLHALDPSLAGAVAAEAFGFRCLTLSAVVGLAVFVTFTIALRRSVPVASGLRGAAIGAAAGAWAGLAVFVYCPSDDPPHVLIAHVLPIVGFIGLGMTAIPHTLRL